MQSEVKHIESPLNMQRREEPLSFSLLVDEYQSMVFNTCMMFLKNREDAEDIAQEVFVEVYRSYKQFRGDSALSTWIYRIAVNRSMDFLRMKGRKKRNLFAFRSYGNEDLEKISVVSFTNPQTIMEEGDRQRIIQQAIDELSERQKIAFTLAKVEGLKQDKVAEIMETTVGSVESLLIRAKKKLKQRLMRHLKELTNA